MTRTRKSIKTTTIPSGIAVGVLLALISILCTSAITAKMVQSQWLDQKKIGYGVMVILFFAAWIGTEVSQRRISQHKLMVCLIFASTFFVLLLGIKALFFEGSFSGVGETALLILAGSFLTVFLKIGTRNEKKRRNRKRYYR